MRKVERLKKLRQPLPEECKKVDTSINGDVERLIEEQIIIEKQLYPLRIDHRTVIYVSKEKCTPEYAEMKRQKMNPEPAIHKGGNRCKIDENPCSERDVSKTTIDKYI